MKTIEIDKNSNNFKFWGELFQLYKKAPETDEDWVEMVDKCSAIIKEYGSNNHFIIEMVMTVANEVERRCREALNERRFNQEG